MQHTKTPIHTRLASARASRSIIVARIIRDNKVVDELSSHRNRLNQTDLANVNARISSLRSR